MQFLFIVLWYVILLQIAHGFAIKAISISESRFDMFLRLFKNMIDDVFVGNGPDFNDNCDIFKGFYLQFRLTITALLAFTKPCV